MDHMKCLHKDVIRTSGAGAFTIFRRVKRLLQMMALIVIVAFMTSVLYQNVHGLKDLEVCKMGSVLPAAIYISSLFCFVSFC